MDITKGSMLIANGNPQAQEEITGLVRDYEIEVIKVSSGRELISKVCENREPPIYLALVDDDLDDVPGRALVPLIRHLRPDLYIIFSTRKPSDELEVKMRQTGILFYLGEPLNIALLEKIIIKAFTVKAGERGEVTSPEI